ncbi:alpha/beta hydrolase-fold protein [Peristeroidobacter agariperforans]|uniref:alpha/beta hydrolase-fold protein n=1 Tax=Peristeroidobacter agariperforans TaxID=268404 RepID=UPI0013003223|nr:alpha/beta hydrolase-fold protein [Peristeroidobacter agariperforans]
MRHHLRWLSAVLIALLLPGLHAHAEGLRFAVSIPRSVSAEPVTGRLVIVIAKRETPEPRTTIGLTGPMIVGVDLEQLPAGETITVDATAQSYPLPSLNDLPPGDYFVQATLIRYSQVRRADGHILWVPTQHRRHPFHLLPGNLYSKTQKVHLDTRAPVPARIELTQTIAPLEEPKDTEWLRHVRIKSKLLSEFWGEPTYLRATALLPRDYDEHPKSTYPTLYAQSQERTKPYYFDPDPASHDADLRSARAGNVQTGHEFYQSWKSDGFPRFVVIVMEQSSPFFLEAYSVDSANNGPYGRALTEELIPHLEKTFRLIPQSYARIVQGASTGGWESLALQLKYPDYFGGAWIFNPDPIDFTHYQLMNIYKDENAFALANSVFSSAERPMRRTVEGQVTHTFREVARLEAVLGSKGRSGFQFDAWQSVHGPVGADGYPAMLFDKRSGVIDKQVAQYYRDNGYDLTDYTRRNWPTLGPKLIGKLNFFSGEMDNFYLNLAVYDFQAMLQATQQPHYPGRFEYGRPKQGHNWHLTNFTDMIREMAVHVTKNAPTGADVSGWNY